MSNRELVIDGRVINDDEDCYVIAEIGHNHQGDVKVCKDLFKAAKEAGAEAVKLQKRSNKTFFASRLYNAPYDNPNSYGATYGEHREALEFGRDEYRELIDYSKEIGVTMFATAFDIESADFLAELDMPAYKIASGDLVDIPLIKHVASIGKPILVSTGGGEFDDVALVHKVISAHHYQFCILQCTSGYPVEYDELNLCVIDTFREAFPNTVIGLSSHDNGIAMALVGYVLGARVVEKHFTLNRAWKGTDQGFSLEPPGLRRLVRDLRRARIAMGDGRKCRYSSEEGPLVKMSKSMMAVRPLKMGHVLTREDVVFRAPNDGLPPREIDNVLGKALVRDLDEEENIRFEDLTQ